MIYFDNSASTPLIEPVKEALREEMELFANPSSLHRLGFESEKRLKKARERVASALFAREDEIFFTSGGTEADNLAIFGAAKKMHRRGKKILTTDSEHPAVEECMKKLESEGFEVYRLSTKGGTLDLGEVEREATADTVLAAVMHTNNETGAVYDIAALSKIVKKKNPECLVFCDGVQAFGKALLAPARQGIDLLSVSSHKIHGPKGVGALYVRRGLTLPPHLFGGGQEKGVRNGTENLLGIVGFGVAAEIAAGARAENVKRMSAVRERILSGLGDTEGVFFNLPQSPSCHVLSLRVPAFRSEVLLHMLSEKEIFVSSGSACSSHKGKSPVLKNFGLTDKESDSTLRLSFSGLNTLSEADEFVMTLKDIIRGSL